MNAIIARMQERPIVEIFCKVLECECGKQFFKEYKNQYLTDYFGKLGEGVAEGQGKWLEGLYQLYRFLTEKMDEGTDTNKYLGLLVTINRADLDILRAVNKNVGNLDEESFLFYLRWLEEMLKHDSYIMGQTNVRLSITHMNRKNSISSSFYKDDRVDTKRIYHISEQHLL